jgi:hypothetical protein
MFVLCVLYSKGQKAKPLQSAQRSTAQVQRGEEKKKNPGWGEIFCTRPDLPWGPPSVLYSGHRVSFPVVKRPERGVYDPHLAPR